MEWISVKDRLPNDGDPVLISDGNLVREGTFLKWDGYNSWCQPRGMKEVTHWMPLPKPPLNQKEK